MAYIILSEFIVILIQIIIIAILRKKTKEQQDRADTIDKVYFTGHRD